MKRNYITIKNYGIKVLLCIAFILLNETCFAQDSTSISQKAAAYITDKFPRTRVLYIEHQQRSNHQFGITPLNGNSSEHKFTNLNQTRVTANIGLIQEKKWILSSSLNYNYQSTTAMLTANNPEQNTILKNGNHFLRGAVNYTYFSTLKNKPIFYNTTVAVDGSDKGVERLKGLLSATWLLKANRTTKMSVGIVAIVDPSAQTPVIPTFAYEKKFEKNWALDLILPQRAMLKKDISGNGRISFGSELEGSSFYLYRDTRGLNKTHEMRQIEINSGAIYEHHLGGSLIATFKSGLKSIPTSRIFEKRASFDDYIIDLKPNSSFYFNMGISFNPFSKRKI